MKMIVSAVCAVLGVGAVLHASTKPHRKAATDPVQYCRAVGTIDEPRIPHGPDSTPEWMRRALGLQDMGAVVWRCENGAVLACVNYGPAGPCSSYSRSRVATADMRRECRAHPNEQSLPASITGHYTIYDWGCRHSQAVVVGQTEHINARGFVPAQWKRIAP